MSAGYATKLSYRDDLGGHLGDPELQDAAEDVVAKIATLADLVSSIVCISQKLIMYQRSAIMYLACSGFSEQQISGVYGRWYINSLWHS